MTVNMSQDLYLVFFSVLKKIALKEITSILIGVLKVYNHIGHSLNILCQIHYGPLKYL